MKWLIPAKTFLLGEYAALAGASAIVLTTTPYFKLKLSEDAGLEGIHPESPAGLFWTQQKHTQGLIWHDPYQGCGGLGASSAQFLASYLASCSLQNILPKLNATLRSYYQYAWPGQGIRPSGYDVIAQARQGCVFINKELNIIQSYPWPFKDLSFLLIHTGVKLATHDHLQTTPLPAGIEELAATVEQARIAFENRDSALLIQAINTYHEQLKQRQCVAKHSLEFLDYLKTYPEILASKGCGAMGADILLVLCAKKDVLSLKNQLMRNNCSILGTEEDLTPVNAPFFV
ncbi:MAG: hypothetical protein EPN84_05625 [Legionella sp.]|nr:MAG: hypothetical protein EPN84_05625 [Legionella sp.]